MRPVRQGVFGRTARQHQRLHGAENLELRHLNLKVSNPGVERNYDHFEKQPALKKQSHRKGNHRDLRRVQEHHQNSLR